MSNVTPDTHLITIQVLQRLAVAASCLIFWLLATQKHLGRLLNVALFAILALLACTEKLSSIMNTVSIERDWVQPAPPSLASRLLTYVRLSLSQATTTLLLEVSSPMRPRHLLNMSASSVKFSNAPDRPILQTRRTICNRNCGWLFD